jgi:hypothetical protein
MARVDLHNFFQFYDERNPKSCVSSSMVRGQLYLLKILEIMLNGLRSYRGKETSAAPALPLLQLQ